jgi:thioester reductase-like protein
MADDVFFLTGFPGFIATRLLRTLLERHPGARAAVLVESTMRERAVAAAERLGCPERIEVVVGDIADRTLGLSDAVRSRLREQTTQAFHLAAIYDLAVPFELAQRVNVDGTGNVLDLLAGAPALKRLHYVSTAYVAGLRSGVVYEHELVMGQAFKNHYESTKFQAEVWARAMLDRIPTTIYRPAIVVGDSRTGKTQKFDGPYYLLRFISRLVQRGQPIPQIGRSEALFNVVPVDFVVSALAAGVDDDAGVGLTLHLVDPDPVSAGDLLVALSRQYAGRTPSYRLPSAMVEGSLRSASMRRLLAGTPRESIRYLNHPVRFDTRVADRILAAQGVSCPRFVDYLAPMVEFFRAHEHDPGFGARASSR